MGWRPSHTLQCMDSGRSARGSRPHCRLVTKLAHTMRNGAPGWTWDCVLVNGRKLHFLRNDTVSADPPIVHLHGFALSGSYLMPTAKKLSGRGRNIVPDLPGYGRSPYPRRAPLDIPALAQCVVALIEALDLPPVTLLGNSMGCPIALEVAHLAPSRVEQLILVSPAGGIHNQPLLRALAQLLLDGPRERLSMFLTAIPDYLRFGPINMIELFKEMTQFPSLDRLLHVPVPVTVIHSCHRRVRCMTWQSAPLRM